MLQEVIARVLVLIGVGNAFLLPAGCQLSGRFTTRRDELLPLQKVSIINQHEKPPAGAVALQGRGRIKAMVLPEHETRTRRGLFHLDAVPLFWQQQVALSLSLPLSRYVYLWSSAPSEGAGVTLRNVTDPYLGPKRVHRSC